MSWDSETDGKHCPKCGVDIGIWPILSPPWVNRIYFPGCKTRLKYGDAGISIVVMVTLAQLAVGGTLAWLVLTFGRERPGIVALLVLGGSSILAWALFELPATWYMRNHWTLDLVAPSDPGL